MALHQHSGSMIDVFDQWREWRNGHRLSHSTDIATRSMSYEDVQFRDDLLRFVQDDYLPGESGTYALVALLKYERAISEAARSNTNQNTVSPAIDSIQLAPGDIPVLVKAVRLIELDFDYNKLLKCLRRRGLIRRIRRQLVTVALRCIPENGETQVIQVSSLSGRLLRLCDGIRSAAAIGEIMLPYANEFNGAPVDKGCLFGLELLRQQGLITLIKQESHSFAG